MKTFKQFTESKKGDLFPQDVVTVAEAWGAMNNHKVSKQKSSSGTYIAVGPYVVTAEGSSKGARYRADLKNKSSRDEYVSKPFDLNDSDKKKAEAMGDLLKKLK